MARPPRSAALPLVLTGLVLLGLTLGMTSFRGVRIRIIEPAGTASPPVVHRGQEFAVEGIADCGASAYRGIEHIGVELSTSAAEAPDREAYRVWRQATLDPATGRFRASLPVRKDEESTFLYIKVRVQ